MENNAQLIAQCEAKAKQWLTSEFDEQTRNEVKGLMENADKTGLIDAFYKDLEFGTGGLRGIMGAGSNRMNIYTVGMAGVTPTILGLACANSTSVSPKTSW